MKNILFLNTIKKYRSNSLFVKYFVISVSVILIPALIFGSVLLYTMSHNLDTNRKNETTLACKNIASKFDRTVDYINSYYSKLISSPTVLSYIYSDKYIYSPRLTHNAAEINNIFSEIILFQPYIKSIYIYNTAQDYIFASHSSSFFDEFYDTDWYYTAKNSTFDQISLSRNVDMGKGEEEFLSFIYKFPGATDTLAYIVFNISTEDLISMLADTSNIKNFAVYNNNSLLLSNTANADFSDGISGYLCENTGYSVSVSISNEIYTLKLRSYFYIFMCIFILIFLASVFIAYIVSKQYYKSIYNIIDILQTNNASRSLVLTPVNNELEYISNSILALHSNQNLIEEELVANATKLRKLHINVLQDQISPHFILNTLNLISLIDIEEHKGDSKISIIIKLLSDILRAVKKSDQYTLPFNEELEYLKQYCTIENIKYDNSFEFIYDIDENTIPLCSVKFMLQPIVENAINHGILKTPTCTGTIKISSYMQGSDFFVSVSDSGAGFETNKLQKISALLDSDDMLPSSHIGITNVNNRIKLIFGTQYGVSIQSVPGNTCVTLHLPAKKF